MAKRYTCKTIHDGKEVIFECCLQLTMSEILDKLNKMDAQAVQIEYLIDHILTIARDQGDDDMEIDLMETGLREWLKKVENPNKKETT